MSRQASVTSAAKKHRIKVLTFISVKQKRKKFNLERTREKVKRLNDKPAQEPFQMVEEGRSPPNQEIEFL